MRNFDGCAHGILQRANYDQHELFEDRFDPWLLGLRNVELLPAVRWKMINLGKMDKDRHAQALENLEDILFGDFLHPQAGQQNHRDHSVNAGTLRAVRRP